MTKKLLIGLVIAVLLSLPTAASAAERYPIGEHQPTVEFK